MKNITNELLYKLQTSINIARKNLFNAKLKSKQYYDKQAIPKAFKAGQFVLTNIGAQQIELLLGSGTMK